jgi:nucleoid-associated protein YgaU
MYATGTSAIRLRSARAAGPLRHLGRWMAVIVLIAGASTGLARVALGGTEPVTTVVVQPGDTLWSIAASRYPGADTRERVDSIERLNRLSGPVIVAGETLELPPP